MVVQSIVKMWKDYFKRILNSENSANGSAESVEHRTDCKANYMGLEMHLGQLSRQLLQPPVGSNTYVGETQTRYESVTTFN